MIVEEKDYKESKKIVDRYEQQLKQSPENCFEFNINNKVLVNLNEEGYVHWHKKDNEHLPEKYRKNIEELKSKADKEGYVEFQLWEFMRIFGETIVFGKNSIFCNNFRFYKNEMTDCKIKE